MRKSTLFVSAMLTMFLMATMFGVVSAYQQVVKNNNRTSTQPSSQPANVEFAPVPTGAVLPAQPLVVSAEEATTIAVNFLGDPNVFSVEVVDYQGVPTYLVTFSSGDLVYVSSTGAVVASEKLQPIFVAAAPSTGGGNQNQNDDSSGGGNHESSSDSHEEHDGDD